jgi:cell wall-associated NlpC family hydrolase
MPPHRYRLRRHRRSRLALLSIIVLSAAMLGTMPSRIGAADAAPTPPPNPSDQQITTAQAAKDAAAVQVGQLAASITQIQGQIDTLDGTARIAEQKLALALQRQQQAADAADQAKTQEQQAQAAVDTARSQFAAFVRAAYMSAPISGTTGAVLTATDPNALIDQVVIQRYVATHQLDAIGALDRATIGMSNADAAARGALAQQTQAAADAEAAQQGVLSALAQAKTQKGQLLSTLADKQGQLQTAQIALTGLSDQRAAYQAWQQQQAALAAAEAQRQADLERAQQQAAAANKGGGGGGGGGGSNSSSGPIPAGGSWTAAKGQEAVNRVMGFVGMPYAFAAGNTRGPTYGVCEPGDAWNDCHVYGFDCSGLTIYAWAPWLSMDHFAATQYGQVGRYHPSINNLMPGDFVFWSDNGSVSGIGHVAMYIGNGNVIQAPQSGDVIKITNVLRVESGYFGATRPLT